MVITIGRQMGSGGRVIGQMLAQKLGIKYYDKQLLYQAAEQSGMSAELFEKCDEKSPSLFCGMASIVHGFGTYCFYGASTPGADDAVYQAIGEFMRRKAKEESYVVVGRSADYVLRDLKDRVSVFIHAPQRVCIERIMRRADSPLTEKQARDLAEKTNRLRADYYNFYTDKKWGEASGYDLTLDSSVMPLEKIVEVIEFYVNKKLGKA